MSDDARAAEKQAAAEAAAALVEDGMVVGLGTGSTAYFAIAALIARARDGLRISCIPTSERSAAQARDGGLALTDFAAVQRIDLTIDGADAVAVDSKAHSFNLVKGLGGALLREKIVAAASARLVIVVDDSKLTDAFGATTPIPIEVVSFGWQATAARIAALGADPVLRPAAGGAPFHTDGGNLILDCHMGALADPAATDVKLRAIVGVVETGLFIGMASEVFVAGPQGVRRVVP